MQSEGLPTTHYHRIGGAEKVRALVSRFYQVMDGLPEAYGIRKLYPDDLQLVTDELYKFLSGWMGGRSYMLKAMDIPHFGSVICCFP